METKYALEINNQGGPVMQITVDGLVYIKDGKDMKKVEMDEGIAKAFVLAIEALHGEHPDSLIKKIKDEAVEEYKNSLKK